MKKGMVIYEPKGRAGEYHPLACNLYRGCGHGCLYCYAPATLRMDRQEFLKPAPRKDIIERLAEDAPAAARDGATGNVLLCFTCDPYQPMDEVDQLTRQAIELLHGSGFNVTILTKGGKRAERDFDLLRPGDEFATTLTFLDDERSRAWEQMAALPEDRIDTLWRAHELGIKTWVSLEPIIAPRVSIEIIRRTRDFVDLYKVGTLNYIDKLPEPFRGQVSYIDWHWVATEVLATLKQYGCQYYIKKDLANYLWA